MSLKGGEGSDRVGRLSQPLFWEGVWPPVRVSLSLILVKIKISVPISRGGEGVSEIGTMSRKWVFNFFEVFPYMVWDFLCIAPLTKLPYKCILGIICGKGGFDTINGQKCYKEGRKLNSGIVWVTNLPKSTPVLLQVSSHIEISTKLKLIFNFQKNDEKLFLISSPCSLCHLVLQNSFIN